MLHTPNSGRNLHLNVVCENVVPKYNLIMKVYVRRYLICNPKVKGLGIVLRNVTEGEGVGNIVTQYFDPRCSKS